MARGPGQHTTTKIVTMPVSHGTRRSMRTPPRASTTNTNTRSRRSTSSSDPFAEAFASSPETAATTATADSYDASPPTGHLRATTAMRDALIHPVEHLVGVISEQRKATQKHNTKLAYDPKKTEWFDFCLLMCNDRAGTVTAEKLFRFLFYQAFRNKRKSSKNAHRITKSEVDDILNLYQERFSKGMSIPDPDDPIAYVTLSQYRSAVRAVWDEQVANSANSKTWDHVYVRYVKDLMRLVQGRQARVDKARYVEKIDGDFSPFTTLHQIGDIEAQLFLTGTGSYKEALPSLRNRFIFLNCYSSIIRHESLFLGELSDMVGLRHQRLADPAEMFIMVCQIATGKTVYAGNSKQYGRALRHRKAEMCSVGAFGFYLLYRFHCSGEMDDGNRPDFASNEDWFDIKILASAKDNKVSIKSRTYTDALSKVFKVLRIVSSAIGHFGRKNGPLRLEFEEIAPEIINCLGMWDPNTQQKAYSAKIPTKALRVMAGFQDADSYFVPRTNVVPPENLQKMIFPFIEEEMERLVHLFDHSNGKKDEKATAMGTLKLWKDLREVILQDAAAMIVEDGKRKDHLLFRMPVFQSELFQVSSFVCVFVLKTIF